MGVQSDISVHGLLQAKLAGTVQFELPNLYANSRYRRRLAPITLRVDQAETNVDANQNFYGSKRERTFGSAAATLPALGNRSDRCINDYRRAGL
jgi:hypothetical protein